MVSLNMDIYFDVDSTLVSIEGLDWIAEQKGIGDQVKILTEKSMNGEIPMEEIFTRKMYIISPTRQDFERLGQAYITSVVDDAPEVVAALQELGHTVGIITGNFNPAVSLLADHLGIPANHTHTNRIVFGATGEFVGFAGDHPLSSSQGKAQVIQKLKNGSPVYYVGDSAGDMETAPFIDLFIGYGGVVEREKVKNQAETFISCFSLAPLLEILLIEDEKKNVPYSLRKRAQQLYQNNTSHKHARTTTS